MSVTARTERAAWPDAVQGVAGTVLVAAALTAAWLSPWSAVGGIAARVAQGWGLAPGTDATLLSSGALPMDPAPALWAASWFGAPLLLGAALLAGQARPLLAAAIGLAACLNPLALHAYASGWGLAAPALFAFAVQIVRLPQRPYLRGMTLAGAGLAAATACVPGGAALLLPVFAVLFLAAPRPWAPGTMRALYVTAFALPFAWVGTLAYAGWQTGAVGAPVLATGPSDAWHLILGAGLAAACAPGVAARAFARPEGAALLILAALAFVSPGVPDTLAVFTAWSAQAATAQRGGAADAFALAVGTLASGLAMVLLA